MSRSAKLIVAMMATLLVLGGCSAIKGAAGADPGKVTAAAGQIADFDLPAGYQPEATAGLGGYLFVSYAPGDGHSHIQLIQAPKTARADQATLEKYIQQAASRGSDRSTRVKTVGETPATIRGQAVTLVISEGTNHDGDAYRTLTGVFAGKGGPALVSVESPISSWDQAAVDAFIASIR